jgi:hypothetical protein
MTQTTTWSGRRGSRGQTAPSSVRWAVWLLYVGALLPLVSVVLVSLQGSPNASFVSSAIVGIGLPLMLTHLVKLGHRWARVAVWIWAAVLTVTAGIAAAGSPWSLAQTLATLFGLSFIVAASVLLAVPRSNQYFRRT